MPGSRRHIDLETAARAVSLLQEGQSQRYVAMHIGVSRRAIRNVWERYQETGSVARRPGTGRARATTAQEDRYLRLTARRERTVTARTLQILLRQSTGMRVSDSSNHSESASRRWTTLQSTSYSTETDEGSPCSTLKIRPRAFGMDHR